MTTIPKVLEKAFDPRQMPVSDETVEGMRSALQEEDSGFTVHPTTGRVPEHSFQVGIDGQTMKVGGHVPSIDEVNRMSDAELKANFKHWLRKNCEAFKDPGLHVGGWHEPGTHKIHIDLAEDVSDPREATGLGRERNQVAIWDNEKGAIINTGGAGD